MLSYLRYKKAMLSPNSEMKMALPKKQSTVTALSKLDFANILNGLTESAILPKFNFIKQLHIEMRRTDRSKSPLSMALISINNKNDDQLNDFINFLKSVQSTIRQTDTIGYLDWNFIGIIFPDTNEIGMQQCIEKIVSRNEYLSLTITRGTYPDQLFAELLSEKPDRSDTLPLFYDNFVQPGWFLQLVKRGIDIAGSLFGLLIFSPIILVTAVVVKSTSEGPAIFKQTRLGKKGTPFTFYKFRSMYTNNDDRIHREYVSNLIQGNHEKINNGDKKNPLFKIVSDPRITPVGRFIRRTSIDELPQFFNVLKGDMSLVGPRPPLPYEAKKYESWHLRRILETKPGITGLWQVEGRSKTSFDDMVRLDLCYVRDWSLMLDLKLLIKTIKVIFGSSGAH